MDKRTWAFIAIALGLAVLLGAVISPFASSSPDGLDKFAEDHAFSKQAEGREVWAHAPLPDYKVSTVEHEGLSTGMAGALGTLAVFGLAFGVARLLSRRKNEPIQAADQ